MRRIWTGRSASSSGGRRAGSGPQAGLRTIADRLRRQLEVDAGLTSTPTKAASSEGLKKELGESSAPSPPAGGAAALGELLATQQRRLAGLVPELEEGQRREEELVAKLEAVLQVSQVRALQSSLHCLFALTTTRNTKNFA